jgi:hypothetical protein
MIRNAMPQDSWARALLTNGRAPQPWNLPGAGAYQQQRLRNQVNASFSPEQRRTLAAMPAVRFGTQPAPAPRPAPVERRAAPTYAPTLPALTADQIAYFGLRAGEAGQALSRAELDRGDELSRLGLWESQQDNRLKRQGYQAGRSLRDELSGSGLGFSPMFVNRGMRDISGQVAASRADVSSQVASRQEALKRMVDQARDMYNTTMSRIELERRMAESGQAVQQLGGMR